MGGSQSSQPSAAAGEAPGSLSTGGPPTKVGNNNEGDVVIIPVDASKQAETAFLWYVNHVHRPENIVRIIHCQELKAASPMLSEHAFKTESWVSMMESAQKDGRRLVELYEKKLNEHQVRGSVHFEVGSAGDIVVNAANDNRAAMIIMGTRGFGLVRRTILGSVSEYVIHHAKVPVTVVPRETQNWFF